MEATDQNDNISATTEQATETAQSNNNEDVQNVPKLKKKVIGYWHVGEFANPNEKPTLMSRLGNAFKSQPKLPPPKKPNCIRFVCVSDTHARHTKFPHPVPEGDVLLHAGDFTLNGGFSEVEHFNEWLGTLPHKHKVVIAGNHDVSFHPEYYEKHWGAFHKKDKQNPEVIKKSLTNCTYLEDSETTIEGIRIYGSPWQPAFGGWAFNLERGKEIREKWDLIPENVDIVITHGPPSGRLGGITFDGTDAGCEDLKEVLVARKPLVHLCGHIHEGYGVREEGGILYINASICNLKYQPFRAPVVFDIEVTTEKQS